MSASKLDLFSSGDGIVGMCVSYSLLLHCNMQRTILCQYSIFTTIMYKKSFPSYPSLIALMVKMSNRLYSRIQPNLFFMYFYCAIFFTQSTKEAFTGTNKLRQPDEIFFSIVLPFTTIKVQNCLHFIFVHSTFKTEQ